jgi:hypothetical protein
MSADLRLNLPRPVVARHGNGLAFPEGEPPALFRLPQRLCLGSGVTRGAPARQKNGQCAAARADAPGDARRRRPTVLLCRWADFGCRQPAQHAVPQLLLVYCARPAHLDSPPPRCADVAALRAAAWSPCLGVGRLLRAPAPRGHLMRTRVPVPGAKHTRCRVAQAQATSLGGAARQWTSCTPKDGRR